MKSLQFRMMLLLLFAGVLLLSVVSVAGAAPSLVGLTSPTHPDENIWYSGNDPVFTWIRDLGHVGHSSTAGNPGGVAVLSHYAYKADGASGLKIIDISNPASPVLTGSLDTTGSATDIAVSGNYAYIADGASGLKIIDISNPASPVLTGSFDMIGYVSATGIAVSGNNAYIAYGASGLQIIDISDPANPVLTGSLDTIGSATDIAVTGNYAYIADGVSGLQIINISNPASPVLTGSRDTTGSATSIAVSGNYAYIADGVSGLQIINISDPASPLIASTFDTTDNANGVAFRGSRVYLTYSQEQYGYRNNPYPPFGGFVFLGILEGLAEIDVSDPAAPRTVGSSYHEYGWQHVSGVALDGNYTYVAGSELEVFDIGPAQYSCALDHSPSTSPDTIAESADNSTSYNNLPDGEYYFHVAAVEGASLGPVSHRRVRIDSSCNSRPLLNIENPNPYWASYSDYSARILSVGYSMFNDGTSGAFNISIAGVSTSDGAEWCGTSSCDEPLSIVGSFPIANAERVEVDGSNAYVAASTDGLKIIDISDPANPVMAGSYDTPEYAEDMVLDGSYAYVADWNSL
ncbi:MAG: hypothetical protein Q7K29_04675, partial [Thermoleophilia bacterium]|nr:hypothetical protein [Thermoleophilia bacterium]